MPAFLGHADRVKALARSEVEQVGIIALTKRNVGRQLLAGREIGKLLAVRRVDVEAGRRLAAHRDVEIAVDVCSHAVAAIVRKPVDQHAAITDRSVRREIIGETRHQTFLRGLALCQEVVRAVVMSQHIECLLIRRHLHAVRLAGIGNQSRHLAVRVEPIDRLDRLLDRLLAQVTRIGEVDAALLVDREVVGRVERLALVEAAQDVALAGLHVGLGQAPAAEVGALGNDQVALGVELDAVRHAARRAEDRGLLVFGSYFQMFPACSELSRRVFAKGREGDVAEVDHAVRAGRDALRQRACATEHAVKLCSGGQHARVAVRRRKPGHQPTPPLRRGPRPEPRPANAPRHLRLVALSRT